MGEPGWPQKPAGGGEETIRKGKRGRKPLGAGSLGLGSKAEAEDPKARLGFTALESFSLLNDNFQKKKVKS